MPPAVRSLTNTARITGTLRGVLPQAGPVPQHFSRKHPAAILQVEDCEEWQTPEMAKWRRVKRGQDGADDTLEVSIPALHAAGGTASHFRRLYNIFHPNNRVRLLAPWGGEDDRILFQGYPQVTTLSWSKDGSSMSITCLSQGQDLLRTSSRSQILGRAMRQNPAGEWNSAAPLIQQVERFDTVFNQGGQPNRTAEAYRFGAYDGPPGGEGSDEDNRPEIYLFTVDNDPDAEFWTYVQALRYVAYLYIRLAGLPISVGEFLADTKAENDDLPCPNVLDPFSRRITAHCPDVSVQSLNADEAIATLCGRAGLHYHIPIRSTGSEGSVTAQFYLRVHATVGNINETKDGAVKTRYMREGKAHDLPREAPYRDHTGRDAQAVAEANRPVQANITIDPRAYNYVIGRGGPITYEVTLLLRPGWAAHPYLDLHIAAPGESQQEHEARQKAALDFWVGEFEDEYDENGLPNSRYHGQHADNHTVAEVFRLWVFPDVTDYVNLYSPRRHYDEDWYTPFLDRNNPRAGLVYAHSTRGGGLTISNVRNWVPAARPFRNTIGRTDLATSIISPIVHVNFGPIDGPDVALTASGWVRRDDVEIDTERAAIRFKADNLLFGAPFLAQPDNPDDRNLTAIARYITGQFYVSITCTIEADERMRESAYRRRPSVSRRRTQVMDYGLNRYLDRRQTAGSRLFDNYTETDPAFQDRNDSEALRLQVRRDLEHLSGDTVSGTPEIFWFDQTYWVGDSFSGIAGLGIPFFNYPSIERIEYVNAGQGSYRTVLALSDMRDSPEIDSE